MTNFPVTVGRRTDIPKADIIFGGVSVRKNHGRFNQLQNGLIQFELTEKEALLTTYINGQTIKDGNT